MVAESKEIVTEMHSDLEDRDITTNKWHFDIKNRTNQYGRVHSFTTITTCTHERISAVA